MTTTATQRVDLAPRAAEANEGVLRLEAGLRYRRQFVASSRLLTGFAGWQHRSFGVDKLEIYAHPDLMVTPVLADADGLTRMLLLGFAFDPDYPGRSDEEIIRALLARNFSALDEMARAISKLAGRFVLIVCFRARLYVFHDPCGLRSVYYTEREGEFYLGSQPLVFSELFTLVATSELRVFNSSAHARTNIEYWTPSGLSFFEGVHQLVPNHYLDLTHRRQYRFWPFAALPNLRLKDAVEEAVACLGDLVRAANSRFKLALPLTAGWDSRTVLAACRDIQEAVYVYTLRYRDLTPQSADVRVPAQMLAALGLPHHILDCLGQAPAEFKEVYRSNVALAHDDWGTIAYGLLQHYPQERVCLKGNCSEIARCFYYTWGRHAEIKTGAHLAALEPGWAGMPFIVDHLEGWLQAVREVCPATGLDVLDLFYWEHRMGSWQAQSQLEWDIAQEAYTPFNCRRLLGSMLAVPSVHRRAERYIVHRRMIKRLWPQLLKWPINPSINARQAIKKHLGAWLRYGGVYKPVNKVYRYIKRGTTGLAGMLVKR